MHSDVWYLVRPGIFLSCGITCRCSWASVGVMTVSMRSRLLAASSTVTTSGMAASAAVTSSRSAISQSTSTSARHICFGSPIRWAVLQAAPDALSRSQRAARVVAWTPRMPAASDQLIRGAICRALIS